MFLFASIVIAALLLFVLYWRRGILENDMIGIRAMNLPSKSVVDRIFSAEDLSYSQSLPKRVRAMFVRDRRALALSWVRQIRQVTVSLMGEHGRAVRRSTSLQLWKEVQIAGSFISLLASCEFLALMVMALGPVQTGLVVSSLGVRLQSLQAELGDSYLSAYGTA